MALVTTKGSASATSFVTVSEASTYISAGPYVAADWTALSTSDKELRLVMAAKLMNALRWRGHKIYRNQALAFPRWTRKHGWTEADAAAVVVPENIKKAQSWIAWDVIHRGIVEASATPPEDGKAYSDISSFSLGGVISVSASRNSGSSGDQTQLAAITNSAQFPIYLLLSPYLTTVACVPRIRHHLLEEVE